MLVANLVRLYSIIIKSTIKTYDRILYYYFISSIFKIYLKKFYLIFLEKNRIFWKMFTSKKNCKTKRLFIYLSNVPFFYYFVYKLSFFKNLFRLLFILESNSPTKSKYFFFVIRSLFFSWDVLIIIMYF